MSAFSITPQGPFLPIPEGGFPNYIQWQFNGVNLGDPTITKIDIRSGLALSVVRGAGENSGLLTITIPAT